METETQSQSVHMVNGETSNILKVLANPDAVKILHLTGAGIVNSTYAREEFCLPLKRYYTRLKMLLDSGLVKKRNGVYIQTAMGRIIYDHFLPAMGNICNAKKELELIEQLKGTEQENRLKKRLLGELGIPDFSDSNMKILGDYETFAVTVIDLYDSAKESVLLASNYIDVRVIEAFLRAGDRGVTNRVMMGKRGLSSKMMGLRMMLSVTFAKTIINFASNTEDLKNTIRFADIPYTFCVVDGHRNIIEFSDKLNDQFIAALFVDDRDVGEKLTKFYETIWQGGEFHSAIEGLNYLKSG